MTHITHDLLKNKVLELENFFVESGILTPLETQV